MEWGLCLFFLEQHCKQEVNFLELLVGISCPRDARFICAEVLNQLPLIRDAGIIGMVTYEFPFMVRSISNWEALSILLNPCHSTVHTPALPLMLKFTLILVIIFLELAWPLLPQRLLVAKSTLQRSWSLNGALPDGYQEFGEHVIRKAGEACGVAEKENLDIEWKADRIIVTVRGSVYVSTPGEAEDEEAEKREASGVDITELARAINAALGEGEVGNAIAETHEIEVGTPGAPDELTGVMFEAYKGFDVICRYEDPKTKKVKEIVGRYHDRTDEITTINIKGRMKKIKNEAIESLRLPKAKKEKGAK